MITRIRETDGGYTVAILTAEGQVDARETASLAEAFAWQKHVQEHGMLPEVPQHEPEVTAAKKRGKAK